MTQGPLEGHVVVDATRMLPGAVLARCLLDLGARVIKIEAPGVGDPMRRIPPLVDGVGAGFAEHYRGAESVALDLRDPADAARLRGIVAQADVFVESFRPGTLDRWGLSMTAMRAHHPPLVTVSLPAAPQGSGDDLAEVGHDLNFVARSGLLARLRPEGLPSVLAADVTTGLLAAQGVLAALLGRTRTGRGCHVEQPIAAGPLPFLWWPVAEHAHGAERGATTELLAGKVAAYRVYRCADGLRLAVGCLEPKFWVGFCDAIGRKDLAGAGLDLGPRGRACIEEMERHLAGAERAHWLNRVRGRGLPVGPVHDGLGDVLADPLYRSPPLGSAPAEAPPALGPALPSMGSRPERGAPALGAHTAAVLREFGAA
ncbi:MAG: hypothetical protein D6705_11025 [Deltaproteobacteria bacterium]|nr:MAG: hypothetical protein D6705_11025 [Deltaproteobacteria bacterium]